MSDKRPDGDADNGSENKPAKRSRKARPRAKTRPGMQAAKKPTGSGKAAEVAEKAKKKRVSKRKPPKAKAAAVERIASITRRKKVPKPPPTPSSEPSAIADPVDALCSAARALIEQHQFELRKGPTLARAAWLSREIGRLYEWPLEEPAEAALHYQKAYAANKQDRFSMHGARRTLVAAGDPASVVRIIDTRLARASDARRRAVLLYEKGCFIEDVLADERAARNAFVVAAKEGVGQIGAQRVMEQDDYSNRRWIALAEGYERMAERAGEDDELRGLRLLQQARMVEARQKDPIGATLLYELALDCEICAPQARAALVRLYRAQRRWLELSDLLIAEAEATSGAARKSLLLYDAARILAEQLQDRDAAIEALLKGGDELLERLPLETLAGYLEAEERYEELGPVLQKLLALHPGAAERQNLLHRLGGAAEQVGDEEAAITQHQMTLEADPSFSPALRALGKLYTERERWGELTAMHLAEGAALDDPRRHADSHARAAEVYERRMGADEEAIAQYRHALELAPSHRQSVEGLLRLLGAAGQLAEMCALLEAVVEAEERPDTLVGYFMTLASLYSKDEGGREKSLAAYRKVLAIDGEYLAALHGVQGATEALARWDELVEALLLESELTEEKARLVELLQRAGEVLDRHLGQDTRALDCFQRVMEIQPNHRPTFIALGRFFDRTGRWRELLGVYQRELDVLKPQGGGAAMLFHKMAIICHQKLQRPAEAVEWLYKAVEEEPNYGPARATLEGLLHDESDWEGLYKLLKMKLEREEEAPLRAAIACRVGLLQEEQLGDLNGAIEHLQLALECVPGYPAAIAALQRLRVNADAWRSVLQELTTAAAQADVPSEAVLTWLRAGEIYRDELNEPEQAAECFEQVLQLEPNHATALLALELLWRHLGRWSELVEIYTRHVEVFANQGMRLTALIEVARIREQHLDAEPSEVAAAWEAVVELDPGNRAAVTAFEALAFRVGERAMLRRAVELRMTVTEDAGELLALELRLAELREAAGEEAAMIAYDELVQTDPQNLPAVRGLVRTAERHGDQERLEKALRAEADLAEDPDTQAELLARCAWMRLEHHNDREGAAADLERAVERSAASTEALQKLVELLSDEPARLSAALQRAIGATREASRKAELRLQIAGVMVDKQGEPGAARKTLEETIVEIPDHAPTQRKLAQVCEKLEDWRAAADGWREVLWGEGDPQVSREARLALARLLEEHLDDREGASFQLNELLEEQPEDREVLRRLFDLQLRAGDIGKAGGLAEQLAELATGPVEEADAYVLLGHTMRASDRLDESLDAFERAISLQGASGEAGRMFLELSTDDATLQRYGNAIERYLGDTPPEPAEAESAYLEVARVRGSELGNAKDAAAILKKGVAACEGSLPLRLELARWLANAGMAADALRELRELVQQEPMRAEVWRSLGVAYAKKHGQDAQQIALASLQVLGAADDDERKQVAARTARPGAAKAGSFKAADVARVDPDAPSSPAAEALLVSISPYLGKVMPAPSGWGQDKLGKRSRAPARGLANSIAKLFGVDKFDVYADKRSDIAVGPLLSDPPAVTVPTGLLSRPEAEQVFAMARVMANVTRGLHAVDALSPEEIAELLAAATRHSESGFRPPQAFDDKTLASRGQKIYKAMARGPRKKLASLAKAYAKAPLEDPAAWVEGIRRTARRVALLVADDLLACVQLLRDEEPALAKLEGAALFETSDAMLDLTRYWASEDALAQRARAGITKK